MSAQLLRSRHHAEKNMRILLVNDGLVTLEINAPSSLTMVTKLSSHWTEMRLSDFTEADKKQLKEVYLQNMIAPKAGKLLEKHFPEEFGKATPQRPARSDHSNQDR